MRSQNHAETSKNANHTLYVACGKMGQFQLGFSPAQAAKATALTDVKDGVQAIAALVNGNALGGQLRFEAMDSEFEKGSARRKGTLYLHVPALGQVPLRVTFDEAHTRNAEEFMENRQAQEVTQAALVAKALNAHAAEITAKVVAERGHLRG